jgi:hypothetical protein
LKTVKWLGDVYGVPIEAITSQLFEDHDGYRHISFERLLPLPGEDEFDMTVRQREDYKRSQNTARRASVLPLLIESGHLQDGDTLWLEQTLLPAAERHTYDPDESAFQVQLHADDGAAPRFAWRAKEGDEAQLLAPSAVCYHVYQELYPDRERAIFSTAVAGSFRVAPDGQTLEELALDHGLWTKPSPGS